MIKTLWLRSKLDKKNKELKALLAQGEDLQKREKELEQAIAESAEATEEEQAAVEEAVEQFNSDKDAYDAAKKKLEDEIAGLENDIKAEEAKQEAEPEEPAPAPAPAEPAANERTRIGGGAMRTRNKVFRSMTEIEVNNLIQRDAVQNYLHEIRAAIKEKRAITNAGVLIPTEFLGLIRENLIEYSKLYKHVFVRSVGGDARQAIEGTIEEAVWTECCKNINELDLTFNDTEFGCFMVAGFYSICNATLEDADIDLAAEILVAISKAIGLALDKAILYGLGTRMPMGIVTRLLQTSQPANYPVTERPWVDLHTKNVIIIDSADMTPAQLFKAITMASGNAKGKYSRGEKVWVMNEFTYTNLMADTITVDANGRIVSGVSDRMPVVGGVIEVLDFLPDNVIIGGYFDLYTLAERAGARFMTSEHVKFLQDKTVFKGVARYDGKPVIAEAFIVIGLNNTPINAGDVEFAGDVANEAVGVVLNKAAVSVAATKTTKLIATTLPEGQAVVWTSSDETKAKVDANGVVTGVAAGNATITAASGTAQASCTVTVTAQ